VASFAWVKVQYVPTHFAPTDAHLQFASPFAVVHQPSWPFIPVPAATQVNGFIASAGIASILVQSQTSPPQTMPPPGQSVSLKQPSPAASALDAENKATEPTKVA
jgi:hypothetical protein